MEFTQNQILLREGSKLVHIEVEALKAEVEELKSFIKQ